MLFERFSESFHVQKAGRSVCSSECWFSFGRLLFLTYPCSFQQIMTSNYQNSMSSKSFAGMVWFVPSFFLIWVDRLSECSYNGGIMYIGRLWWSWFHFGLKLQPEIGQAFWNIWNNKFWWVFLIEQGTRLEEWSWNFGIYGTEETEPEHKHISVIMIS